MLTIVLDAIGWPLGVLLAAVAAWCLYRLARTPKHPHTGRRVWNIADGGYWFTGLMFAVAAVADFTVLGLIGVTAGIVIAGIMTAALVLLGRPWQWGNPAARRSFLFSLRTNPAGAVTESAQDARGLWRWLVSRIRGAPDGGGGPGEIPLEAVADYAASRAIPSLMEDAALGAPAEPAAIAQAGIPVPPPWAQLAAWIRDREPADDTELRMFHDGDAAGALAVADARHAYAETCLNAVRLSPAYVAGELEAADSMAEHASMLTQVGRRFTVIYGALKEWISGHGPLPNKGDFLTGD